MESSAFPDKIMIKSIESNYLSDDKNISCAKVQQVVCLLTGNIGKLPFSILIGSQREMHQSKKGQRKNLAQAIY